jgi:tetratricopeptide (TPR) repeat protein
MAGGIMLLLAADQAAAADIKASWQAEAQAVLSTACQRFGDVLQLPSLPAEGSSNSASSGRTAAKASSGARKAQHSSGRQQGRTSPAAEAAAAAPDTLASAALCHCLLGVALAQSTLCDSTVAGSSSSSSAQEAGSEPASSASCAERSNSTHGKQLQYSIAAWHSAERHMRDSIRLFELSCAAGGRWDSSAGSRQQAGPMWYADEAAMAVAQAWHIAALQDWHNLTNGFCQVLARLAGQCSNADLSPLLQTVRACSTQEHTWLSVLLQQAALPSSIAWGDGAATECPDRGDNSDASGRMAEQQPPECLCKLQQHCRALHEAVASSMPTQQAGHTGWRLLQQIQVQLAAADADAWAGDTAAAAAGAELALLQCKSVLGSLGSAQAAASGADDVSTSRTGITQRPLALDLSAGSSGALHCHALGMYMSGLWQLSGTLEAAGNPQDAVRMLKELHTLSSSAGCYSFAALAQAQLSSIYSRMKQCDKAAAAVAGAQELQHVLRQVSSADGRSAQQFSAHALVDAAVASAQAAVALASQQPAQAQEHLQAGLSALGNADAGPGLYQFGWRFVQQRAELHLQSARCHLLLHGEDEALVQLQAAMTFLKQQSQSSCRYAGTAAPIMPKVEAYAMHGLLMGFSELYLEVLSEVSGFRAKP